MKIILVLLIVLSAVRAEVGFTVTYKNEIFKSENITNYLKYFLDIKDLKSMTPENQESIYKELGDNFVLQNVAIERKLNRTKEFEEIKKLYEMKALKNILREDIIKKTTFNDNHLKEIYKIYFVKQKFIQQKLLKKITVSNKETALSIIHVLNSLDKHYNYSEISIIFSDLAKKHSEDKFSTLGGNLGFKEKSDFPSRLSGNIFKLGELEYTKSPIMYNNKYLIFLSLNNSVNSISYNLFRTKFRTNNLFKNYVQKLSADISINRILKDLRSDLKYELKFNIN